MHDRSNDHGRHDELLVAALAADDLAGAERDRALAQLAGCIECRTLYDDLRAIAAATAALPAPVRTRDFRLRPADVARLDRRRPWSGLLDALLGSGGIGRPLATGLTALGLAGLLIAAPLASSGVPSTALSEIGASSGAGVESQFNAAPAAGAPSAAASTVPNAAASPAAGRGPSADTLSPAPAFGSVQGSPATGQAGEGGTKIVAGPSPSPAFDAVGRSVGSGGAGSGVGTGVSIGLAAGLGGLLLLALGLGLFAARRLVPRR